MCYVVYLYSRALRNTYIYICRCMKGCHTYCTYLPFCIFMPIPIYTLLHTPLSHTLHFLFQLRCVLLPISIHLALLT